APVTTHVRAVFAIMSSSFRRSRSDSAGVRRFSLRRVGSVSAGCELAQSRTATMLSQLTGGTNPAFKAAGLIVAITPTKEQHVTYRHAIAGALILNIPMLVAAASLPAAATATMAVCLAALGAALGTL